MSKTSGELPWAEYLQAAMDAARLSQAELSRESGVNQTQISLWRAGESQPSLILLRKLVRPLGVPILELLVAAGHLSQEEARLRDAPRMPERIDARAAIEQDRTLTDDARRIVLAAYTAALGDVFGAPTAQARQRLQQSRRGPSEPTHRQGREAR